MVKYSTKFRSRKNKRRSKINKSRRLINKYRKKTRKRKQKRTKRRNLRGGRVPPYSKKELLLTIRGAFVSETARRSHNPFIEKFTKVVYLLKYVNWLNSMKIFQDKIDEYNEKTNLVNIVNMLYDSYQAEQTYENALDNIIRQLAGLAMRGVPEDQRGEQEEGKPGYIDFQNPTDDMIDSYFQLLYQRVHDVVYYNIEELVPSPPGWEKPPDWDTIPK